MSRIIDVDSLVSHKTAASRLGLTHGRITQLVLAGLLTPVVIDGRPYFTPAELARFRRLKRPSHRPSAKKRKVEKRHNSQPAP